MKLNFGPRLREFAYRPPEEDKRFNFLVGAVRSGKTWSMIPKILYGCRYNVGGWRVITGVSKQTIYNNVLNDLFNLIGSKHYTYNSTSGFMNLFGTKWLVLGAHDEGSEKYIRGITIGYCVGDEIVLMPQEFWRMLTSRMSPKGARMYATTNPSFPRHWFKTEVLDNPKMQKDVFHMQCTMDDNPNLPDDFKESIKALYKGLFYQRYILGRWVMADGAIYRDCWSEDLIYDDMPLGLRSSPQDRYVSVDCGVDHPQAYYEHFDDGKIVWTENEYFWDSRKEYRQKTDAQYADDLVEFMGVNNACQIIVPPEAASFRAELNMRGLWVSDADNKVEGAEGGIKTVASMMSKKLVRINRRCKNLIDGIPLYAWDPKAYLRGKELPLKVDDDAVDAYRYGLHGKIPLYRYTL